MGLKLLKTFNYFLSHLAKAGFTVNVQATYKEEGIVNDSKNRQELIKSSVSNVLEI